MSCRPLLLDQKALDDLRASNRGAYRAYVRGHRLAALLRRRKPPAA